MTAEPTLTLDGLTVPLQGETNLLEVIRKAHIELPTFCYHSELSVYGACRLCMVDVAGRGLVAACSTVPEPGMSLRTQTPQIRELRKTNIELLLASGNHHCPTCGKSGACKLQSLAERLGVTQVRFKAPVPARAVDSSSPSLLRDPSKCILCGDCVQFCEEIQGVGAIGFTHRGAQAAVAPAFGRGLAEVDCVNCGQCAAVCPVGALTVRPETEAVFAALGDPAKTVVAQVAPGVRAAIGEAFGLPGDAFTMGRIAAALRRLGFRKVYDTAFTADLTIWEEATEFLRRREQGGPLPLYTSCCPAWVKLAEHDLPDLLENLSTCRSPQAMFGSLAKEVLPGELGIRREDLVVVSVMPCTAKKFEAKRPELQTDGHPDTDFVITTQELARMIQEAGLQFGELPVDSLDMPFGFKTGAGVIFANSGGVAEAVMRYVAGRLSPEQPAVQEVRSGRNRREFALAAAGGGEIRMAVAHGLAEAQRLVKDIRAGRTQADFVEVMACPGGCVGGAGQPAAPAAASRQKRAAVIRDVDASLDLHCPQENPHIQQLYQARLDGPGGPKAHQLLHTHYHSRRRIQGQALSLSEATGEAKVPVSFCLGTACHLRGAQALLQRVLDHVAQEGLADRFDIRATFCMEACDRGPSVRVNGTQIEGATFERVAARLAAAQHEAPAAIVEAAEPCGCAH